MKISKPNLTTIFVTLVILLLSLQGGFISFPYIGYLDEIFALVSIFGILLHWKSIQKNIQAKSLIYTTFWTLLIVVTLGLLSNFRSKLISGTPILIDLFSMIKLQVSFIFVLCAIKNKEKKAVLSYLLPIAKLFILVVFFFGIINVFFNIGMSFDIRYGVRSYTFLFSNPGGLNATVFAAYSVVSTCIVKRGKRNFYEILALLTVVMTLRGAGIGVVAVIVSLKILNWYRKMNKPINVKRLIPVGVLAVLAAWNQIQEYFISQISLRSLLLRNAFVVMKRYFPLGSGFATYGSDQAFKHYSPLYREFGYNNIYMLSEDTGYVANDNYWPMMIAQFGLVGVIAYLCLLYKQFYYVMKLQMPSEPKITAVALLSVMLIGSTGNAVYTSASGLLMYILLGLIIRDNYFTDK